MDSIADMLTRIRNALMVGKKEVRVPASKLKHITLKILQGAGYIGKVEEKVQNKKKFLEIELKYNNKIPTISNIKRISKPGLRIYTGYQSIPRPLGGLGLVIMSTPKGVMSGQEARKKMVGGEIICEVY